MLLFSFSSSVSLSQITLGSVSGDSDFRYWIGDSASTADSLFGDGTGGTNVIGGSSPASYLLGGTGFNILVSSRPFQSNDSFRIKPLVVNNSVPDSGATFTILGLGCLGLAGLKRRMSA
jgi:hypothetical protein